MEPQLKLLIEGNHDTFCEIFGQYYNRTYQYLKKRTGCDDQAADLTQQCFLRVWQYRNSLSSSHPIEQQIFVIARSLLLNHLQKISAAKTAKVKLIQQKEPVTSLQAQTETTDYISTAFKMLPAPEKTVVDLKFNKGYSNKDIAIELSISVKTVEARVSSAYKKLKSILTAI